MGVYVRRVPGARLEFTDVYMEIAQECRWPFEDDLLAEWCMSVSCPRRPNDTRREWRTRFLRRRPPLEHEIGDRCVADVANRVVLVRRVMDERAWFEALDTRSLVLRIGRNQQFRFPGEYDEQLFFEMRVWRVWTAARIEDGNVAAHFVHDCRPAVELRMWSPASRRVLSQRQCQLTKLARQSATGNGRSRY